MAHHLRNVHGHWIVDDGELVLYFLHQLRTDEDFYHEFFALDALIWGTVLDMQSNDLEELRQETDSKEDLSWSAHAPVQKINQRHYPVCLQHVVSVLSKSTEKSNNLNA